MKNEAVPVENSTKMKKIKLDNYEIMILLMKSTIDDLNNYHVSIECLNIDNGNIYQNVESSFFNSEDDANNYFDKLYDKYSSINKIDLENELKHIV